MKKFSDFVSHLFLLILSFISQNLSIKARYKTGIFIGYILKILSKERSEITLKNIKDSFPDYSLKKINQIRNESYHNLGITLIELLAFPGLREKEFLQYVKIENYELVKEKIALGRGLIFLSGHFGNWELMAYTAGLLFNVPITIVVKPQKNKISDKYLNKFRTQGGNKIVPMSKAARKIVQSIKNNEAIALLADQSADSSKDIFVDFFGRPAVTYEAPAALALKFRTPIITGFAHRQEDFTYKVVLKELEFSDLDNSIESIYELTRRHVKDLEDNIRINPGHWAWQHRRWKHEFPAKK